jgi:hypothetical protein
MNFLLYYFVFEISAKYETDLYLIFETHIFIQLLKFLTLYSYSIEDLLGRVNIQEARCQPFTAEAWFRYQVCVCGIYVGQRGIETGFSPSSSVFSCQYHFAKCSVIIFISNTAGFI